MDKHKVAVLIAYTNGAPCSGLICVDVCPQRIWETGETKKSRIDDITSYTKCDASANLYSSQAIIITHNEQTRER